jgi:uncharacterized tellurite resistance protein B-like protein
MEYIYTYSDNFYLHVAKLFYAVAYIDGHIREEEVQALEYTLRKEWQHKYQGRAKVVDEILKNFYKLQEDPRDADESFYEFVQYKKDNEQLFSIPMRNTLWEVSCAVADKVHKKNKSELILLVNLGKQLGIMK